MQLDAAELRRRRQRTGLKVKVFAPLVGVSGSHLYNLELGHKQPSPEVLARIADRLGCEPSDLMAGEAAA